ncbi:MAG: carbohydrate kinase family protein [Pseudomonadota bacterium]
MLTASCVGGVTLDILVLEDDEASKLGWQKQDVRRIELTIGGGGANASSVLAKLGVHVTIHCALGQDNEARMILNALHERKIDISAVESGLGHPTGKAVIRVGDTGEASVQAARGANLFFSGTSIRTAASDLLYVSSAPARVYSEVNERLADAPNAFKFVTFNPGSRQIAEAHVAFKTLFQSCDLLLLNTQEARQYARNTDAAASEMSVELLCRALGEKRHGATCITNGEDGAWLARNGLIFHQPAAPLPTHSDQISTIGAGDTFGSTLTYLLAQDENPEFALDCAARNAAATVSRLDASSGAKTIQDLLIIG